ncbi:hypothetical protein [Erythrobacter rubeus]|uniref:Pectinesterase inhibitor domain-containing protein n=1 Tax=Erythrobacter rubeus TaxID=2760803 RepID=A0ABR8KWU6_9SPHN|nr:hypothetical protein [Erythrobacter rubeus]MBD2842681.1 hypothetical protein [Erythrobacter rubeus]
MGKKFLAGALVFLLAVVALVGIGPDPESESEMTANAEVQSQPIAESGGAGGPSARLREARAMAAPCSDAMVSMGDAFSSVTSAADFERLRQFGNATATACSAAVDAFKSVEEEFDSRRAGETAFRCRQAFFMMQRIGERVGDITIENAESTLGRMPTLTDAAQNLQSECLSMMASELN